MNHGITLALRIGLFAALFAAPAARAEFMSFVPVGDTGNVADTTGYGSVSYLYEIGKFEVTNGEYAAFLNAVAATADPYSLYNASMASHAQGGITQTSGKGGFTYSVKSGFDLKPVNFVSYYDDVRFVNWMTNGMGSGSTETGSYTLLGNSATPGNAGSLTRSAGAKYVLPTENEWYKAAYYQGNGTYSLYPTRSNTTPAAAAPNSTNANSANYGNAAAGLTDVGSYTLAASFYGTFDQGGNVIEKNESIIGGQQGSRGGSWRLGSTYLAATTQDKDAATLEYSDIGFRVVMIPEPGVFSILASGAALLAFRRHSGRQPQ